MGFGVARFTGTDKAKLARRVSLFRDVLLDAIFPPRCAGCRVWSKELFCSACHDALKSIKAPFCYICGKPFNPLTHNAVVCAGCRAERRHPAPPFQAVRSPYYFEGPLRQAIYRLKYQGKTALATPLAGLLYEHLKQQDTHKAHIPLERIAFIVPVPLHSWRLYRRGYNQSALLATELSKHIARESEVHPATANLLRRVRNTPPQVGLHARERTANVKGAFVIDEAAQQRMQAQQGAVLLVDDVCTTQATLQECARVLVHAGWPEVYALTLARQPAGGDYRGEPTPTLSIGGDSQK